MNEIWIVFSFEPDECDGYLCGTPEKAFSSEELAKIYISALTLADIINIKQNKFYCKPFDKLAYYYERCDFGA